MVIRGARAEDRAALVRLTRGFLVERGGQLLGGVRLSEAQIEAAVDWCLGTAGVAVLVAEDEQGVAGMLALAVLPQPLTHIVIASEVVWYLDPRARKGWVALRLVKAAEVVARARGAEQFAMGVPVGSGVGALLAARGFVGREQIFVKGLTER